MKSLKNKMLNGKAKSVIVDIYNNGNQSVIIKGSLKNGELLEYVTVNSVGTINNRDIMFAVKGAFFEQYKKIGTREYWY